MCETAAQLSRPSGEGRLTRPIVRGANSVPDVAGGRDRATRPRRHLPGARPGSAHRRVGAGANEEIFLRGRWPATSAHSRGHLCRRPEPSTTTFSAMPTEPEPAGSSACRAFRSVGRECSARGDGRLHGSSIRTDLPNCCDERLARGPSAYPVVGSHHNGSRALCRHGAAHWHVAESAGTFTHHPPRASASRQRETPGGPPAGA